MPPQEAGTGYKIVAEHGGEAVVIADVAFGDIWVCSGQSNMEFTMGQMFDADKEIAAIVESTPEMRLFHIQHVTSPEPIDDFEENNIRYSWGKAGDNGDNLRYLYRKEM